MVVHPIPQLGRPGTPAIAPGESVREGQKLVRLADVSRLVLVLPIHESVISTVRPNQLVHAVIDAIPGTTLTGKVTKVSPVASATHWLNSDVKVYPVTIAIEDAPRGLKPGMTGEARIETGDRKGVLRLPRTAVVDDGKDRTCFVKVGRELVERKIVTGAGNATVVEVRAGLEEGDLVVADPRVVLGRQ
jgi:multidrug efflux pump subunit AcrA (membrane-fusion protein)